MGLPSIQHDLTEARRARTALVVVGLLTLLSAWWTSHVLGGLPPAGARTPEQGEVAAALGFLRAVLVIMAAGRLALAYGVGRMWSWAWWTAVVIEGLGLAGVVSDLVGHPGWLTAIHVLLPYWVFRRLFTRGLVGRFTGLGMRNAEAQAEAATAPDPRFEWDATTLAPGGRVLDGYVPGAEPAAPPPPPPAPRPAPSGGFDYFA
jgi:hypothetical protein